MGIGVQFAERRKYPRVRVEQGAYVTNTTKPGLITDISLDGLSWRYVDRKIWHGESPTLDIVIDHLEFSLEGISCTIVSDCKAEHDCPDGALQVRRRSVQFRELTTRQRVRLAEFINRHLAGERGSEQLHMAS
jgi:hypothetical protein